MDDMIRKILEDRKAADEALAAQMKSTPGCAAEESHPRPDRLGGDANENQRVAFGNDGRDAV